MNGTLTVDWTAPVVASSAASALRLAAVGAFTLVNAPPMNTRLPRTTTSLTTLFGTALKVATTAPAEVSLTTRLIAVLPPTEPNAPAA